jgi:hypothetical protein
VRHHQVALITLVAVFLAGCAHDRRGLVATRTLLDSQGAFDQATLGAAIRAKFPPGSPLGVVLSYVRETKGDCKERDGGGFRCEIPYRGGFCWAQMIGMDIEAEASAVKEIKVQVGGLGC